MYDVGLDFCINKQHWQKNATINTNFNGLFRVQVGHTVYQYGYTVCYKFCILSK